MKKWDQIADNELDSEVDFPSAATGSDSLGAYDDAYLLAGGLKSTGDLVAGAAGVVALVQIVFVLFFMGRGFLDAGSIKLLVVGFSAMEFAAAMAVRLLLHGVGAIVRATADTAASSAEQLVLLRKRSRDSHVATP